MRHGHLLLLAGTALFASLAQADPGWRYVITDIQVVDLGTMGGRESAAHDVNDHGEIVGWPDTRSGEHHAFLRRKGAMEDITPFEGYTADANGINNLTQVVGSLRHFIWPSQRGFHWHEGSAVNLLDDAYTEKLDLEYCASAAHARAINDSGVIAGSRIGGCSPPVAFIWRAARWESWSAPFEEIVPLGHAPKHNSANNINSVGTIVGRNKDVGIGTGALRWRPGLPGGGVPLPSVPAPARPSDTPMKAYGVNDGDAIVGSLTLFNPVSGEYTERAYYWNGISPESVLLPMAASDDVDSAAIEINNEGFSVGWGDNGDRWAVVWHGHIGARSLPMAPGKVRFCEALAVNNRGSTGLVQAVGYCVVGGDRHAVLWNITTKKATIPTDSP